MASRSGRAGSRKSEDNAGFVDWGNRTTGFWRLFLQNWLIRDFRGERTSH